MKVKVSLNELEKALARIKKESPDLTITVETEMGQFYLRCSDYSGRLVVIQLFDVDSQSMPKITRTDSL